MGELKTPRLDSGPILRKRRAARSVASRMALSPLDDRLKGTEATIAVTVRLDLKRYQRLKHHGVDRRLTNQAILVKALDAYLGANP